MPCLGTVAEQVDNRNGGNEIRAAFLDFFGRVGRESCLPPARAGGAAGSRLGPWGALGAGLAGAVVGAYVGSRTSRKLPCPCIVGPYGTIRKNCSIYCSDGQAHHIVPDYTLRYVARKDGMASSGRIPNLGPNFYGGISICLEGQAGDDGSEHWEAHGMDPVIKSLGNQQPGTPLQPKGTAPIGQIIGLSKAQINAIRPDCKALVDKLVDMEFDNTNMNSLGRTTADTLPTGDALTALKGGISNTVH